MLHRLQNFVVVAAAVARKHHGGGTALHTAEHIFQGLAVLGGGIRKHIQNIGGGIAIGFQVCKALAGQFPQGGIRSAAGLGKFVQHGFQVGAGFSGGNTVLGKQRIGRGQLGHIVVGSCRHRYDFAHAGGKLVNGGFALVLGGNQQIADFACIFGLQLVAVDCGCHNVNGFCGVGKAALCQLDGGGREIHGIACVHAGGNGAVHSLGKVVDRHAGFAAGRHDVSLVRIKIRAGFVQQGTDLGKGIFKVCRQLYTGNACARHSSGHRRKSLAHAANTVSDSLHLIADGGNTLA